MTTTVRPQPPVVIETLELICCVVCGLWFAVPPAWVTRRREDGRDFWCPNNHKLHYGDNELARLRRQLEQAERGRDAAWRAEEAARKAHAVTKGRLTRARRRTAHGVCPVPGCKRRPFDNLAAHMAQVHPLAVADADRDAGAHPTLPLPVLAVGYGTMRVIATYARGKRYRCQCGVEVGTAGGRAKLHVRTCTQARQPWPIP
jgi:hypothetical protein